MIDSLSLVIFMLFILVNVRYNHYNVAFVFTVLCLLASIILNQTHTYYSYLLYLVLVGGIVVIVVFSVCIFYNNDVKWKSDLDFVLLTLLLIILTENNPFYQLQSNSDDVYGMVYQVNEDLVELIGLAIYLLTLFYKLIF